ncbi:tRNA (guanine(26)-N(2))-dimethyltransferase [Corchorus capsularis]|uniref:tRNA (Guanine(26)-N(2))-dimethyltransferase n=1 Tax=Corchorus capsularis TaxID=210143 RepID=A0A1R3GZZ9_COCAP|nr:tRNA (guanine(26)-N(2))-dimethyltransferase [Corchorus capsularis]
MCGCGIRSLRYLIESNADFVLANDANERHRRVILDNLAQVERFQGEKKRWVITHYEATRVLTDCYLQRDYYDFIDLDSFGSDSSFFLRAAFSSLKLDGLVYVTSTDGYSSGGHRPFHLMCSHLNQKLGIISTVTMNPFSFFGQWWDNYGFFILFYFFIYSSLAAFGAYVRPMPYANELGLRILIGGAVREASVLGYSVTPLFSYYSYHGPVFRVLLRMNRGKLPDDKYYGFICYCNRCGNSQAVSWDKLGQIRCPCGISNDSSSLVVSGPLWTGPLHSADYIMEMLNLAEHWGWVGNDAGSHLEKLLKQMVEESDPRLPFGFIKLDEVARRAQANTPSIRNMMNALHKEGYAASRSHIAASAIKTDCPMAGCIRIAKELHGC